jgi:flagellar FliL protein
MAEDLDEDELDEEPQDEGSAGGSPRRRWRPSRRQILIAAPVLLLVLGGAAGAFFLGLADLGGATEAEGGIAQPKVYFDMPEMLVNLAGRGEQRAQYLKLSVSLELPDDKATAALEPVLPRVVDLFQVYLRELRAEDLEGSAGIYRLKEELIRRVNLEIHPHAVSDVLFKDIIIQ